MKLTTKHKTPLLVLEILAMLSVTGPLTSLVFAGDSLVQGMLAGDQLRSETLTLVTRRQSWSTIFDQILDVSENPGGRLDNAGQDRSPTTGQFRPTGWIAHRLIDPDLKVDLDGSGAVSRAAHLANLADQLDLFVFPVGSCLMCGPADWIDHVLTDLAALPPTSEAPISVTWQRPVTVRELFVAIMTTPPDETAVITETADADAGNSIETLATSTDGWFPHDVWKPGRWPMMDRRVAAIALLSQLDMRWSPNASWERLPNLDLDSDQRPAEIQLVDVEDRDPPAIRIRYPGPPSMLQTIREWAQKRGVTIQTRPVRSQPTGVVVIGPPSAHRRWVSDWFRMPAAASAGAPATAQPSLFTLELVRRPAGDVLRQLAAAAGKACQFEPATTRQQATLVSLNVRDKTLEQLMTMVADKAGLRMELRPDVVRFSP